MAVDMEKLQEFLGRFVTDLGATFAAGNVVTGHHLGLYRALAAGPARAAELAEWTGTNPRYTAEWLRGQAAGGYVEYDPATDTYSMTESPTSAAGSARPPSCSPSPGHRRRMDGGMTRHPQRKAAMTRDGPHPADQPGGWLGRGLAHLP